MQRKNHIPFSLKFHNADAEALRLLERLLAFDPKDRPTAEQALADPYFRGFAKLESEPTTHPISKLEFDFERRKLTKDDVRDLIAAGLIGSDNSLRILRRTIVEEKKILHFGDDIHLCQGKESVDQRVQVFKAITM